MTSSCSRKGAGGAGAVSGFSVMACGWFDNLKKLCCARVRQRDGGPRQATAAARVRRHAGGWL
jgi:hypothetical protein